MQRELRNYYQFIKIQELEKNRQKLLTIGTDLDIKGTILLAKEGINMAICGETQALNHFEAKTEKLLSTTIRTFITPIIAPSKLPFRKYKVTIKNELIKLGIKESETIDKGSSTCSLGEYVEPQQWNTLIENPNTILIDTRNHYEYSIGHFKHALNPNTSFFTEFPSYLTHNFSNKKNKTIALYCTGGIRCEKASYYMKLQQYTQVYQLKGGILAYFNTISPEESLWIGACFVFDDRIAIQHTHDTMQTKKVFETSPPSYQNNRHIQYAYKKIATYLSS